MALSVSSILSTRSSRYGVNPDNHQFSPRVGLAYQLFSKTVIRTGYGFFWIPNSLSFSDAPDENAVNSSYTSFASSINGGVTPYDTFTNPFPNGIVQPPGHNAQLVQQALLGQKYRRKLSEQPIRICSAVELRHSATNGQWHPD